MLTHSQTGRLEYRMPPSPLFSGGGGIKQRQNCQKHTIFVSCFRWSTNSNQTLDADRGCTKSHQI